MKLFNYYMRVISKKMVTIRYILKNAKAILSMPKDTHFTIDYNHGNNRCSRWRYLAHTTTILWKI